jgi:hypothetical protein
MITCTYCRVSRDSLAGLRRRLAGSPLVSIAFLAPESNKLWLVGKFSRIIRANRSVLLKMCILGMSGRQIQVEGNCYIRDRSLAVLNDVFKLENGKWKDKELTKYTHLQRLTH